MLVSGCGVCLYIHLHRAQCKYHFKCNLPAPCAGTHVHAAGCSHAGLVGDTLAPGLSLAVTLWWDLKDAGTDPLWHPVFPTDCLAWSTLEPS